MKILLIGVDYPNMPIFTMAKGFRELGHDTAIIDTYKVFGTCRNPTYDMYAYDILKRQIRLSHLKAVTDLDSFDFIFAQQTWLHYINDLHIPVYYYHSEPQAPITVTGATHVGIGWYEGINFLRRYYPREFFSWKSRNFLWFGVDPSQYKPIPDDEKIPGIHMFVHADKRLEATREDSPYWSRSIYTFRDAVLTKYRDEIIVHPHVEYKEYCETLPTFETVAIVHGNGCYPNQRLFEAIIAGCKVKVYHENELSKMVFDELGEFTRENFLKRHTYLNRAKQILREVAENV